MTITEIQDMVTDKLGRTDDQAIDDCKRFIKRRYKMIWDSTLWLESLATTVEWVTDRDVTLSTNIDVFNYNNSVTTVGDAKKIERVLAVNFCEADVHAVTGITASSLSDYFKYNMDDTSTWSAGDVFYAYGFPNECPGLNGRKTVSVVHADYIAAGRPANWRGTTGNYTMTGWLTADENRFSEVAPVDWWHHFRVDPSKLIEQSTTTSTPTNFVHLPKDASGNARIRLMPGPPAEGLLHVLGKVAWDDTITDDDSPVIQGIDEVLLAYAEGDMLERNRKRQQAQLKFQEGSAFLASIRMQQRDQFGTDTVITPHIYEDARTTLEFF